MIHPQDYLKQQASTDILRAGFGVVLESAAQTSISERLQDAQKLASTALDNLDAMSVRIIGPFPSFMTDSGAGKMVGQISIDAVVKDLTATLGEILATVNRLTSRI